MVDVTNLTQASGLMGEYQALGMALDNLENGGRIVAMEIAAPISPDSPEQAPPPMGMRISTQGMDYPPQMVTSIKSVLTARQDEIAKQLSAIGITGMNQRKGK